MKKAIHIDSLAPIGMVGVTILTGAFLMSSKVSADSTDVVDQINITVPESCTMSGTGMNTHNATVQNNTYTANIGTTTLHAFCNDSGGFAIYAVGYTGNEIGGTNSTKLVGSPSTIGNIDTGTADSGNTSNWAMKVTKTQDSGDATGTNAFTIDNSFNDYHAVPSAYTKVAHKDTVTDMTANTGGVKLTTTYAAFVSTTQPAGTYSGQVKYTLVHPANEIPLQPQTTEAGCIRYYPNGSNVEGTMGCQPITSSDTSATLLASNFSRAGYGFAGWSKAYDYSDSTGFLGPQEDITFTAGQYTGSNNGLSLYARWIKSAGNIQNWSGCSSLTSGSVTALTDQRDGETYAVAKLADGNCWMIENMRLENTNSDNVTGTLAQGYGGQFTGLADPEAPWTYNSTTANSLYSTDGTNDTINIGTSDAGYRFPRYNNVNTPTTVSDRPTSPTANNATNSTSEAGMYSYGNYYTWSAAIADTTYYAGGSQNATSICPTGWHIPTGNTSGEFYTLNTFINSGATNSTASKGLRTYPNNFVYSGHTYNSTSGYANLINRGVAGEYWTSTRVSSETAYSLFFRSNDTNPGQFNTKKDCGGTIRCLASGV